MNTKNPAQTPTNNNNSSVKTKQSDSPEQKSKTGQATQRSPEAGKNATSDMPPRGK